STIPSRRHLPLNLQKQDHAKVNSYTTSLDVTLWGERFWSGSYFAGSVGEAPLSMVKQYIEQQNRLL
ncbi:transposase, partial [Streptosporangium sp. NPDC002721]|uniref:transposase n=1 Tax=Streptosporangium sp. NPDC002721 TaxID=3366188 RepID=UPI0036977458